MLYFAYGSNLDFDQMRSRCPSARFVAVAKFPDHRLAFTRYAKDRGCGTCDAVAEDSQAVWGVVYDVSEADLDRLDRWEGFRPDRPLSANSYVRVEREVCRDGNEKQPVLVWLYVANRQPNPPLPNAAYKQLLVDGAKYWHLPEDYQAELGRIKVAR